MTDHLRTVRMGLVLGALAIGFGWSLGAAFGSIEGRLKDGLRASAERSQAVYLEQTGGDTEAAEAAMEATRGKAWKYYLRAHLHAGGLGATAIALSLLLAFLEGSARVRRSAATLLGAGAVGYPLFWLLAALRAPVLGSTGAAKEALSWLALPSVAAMVTGLAITAYLLVAQLFMTRSGPKG